MPISLVHPPSPYLLPLLLLLVVLELALILGKKQRCKPLALEIKGLTLRKVNVIIATKSVSTSLWLCMYVCMHRIVSKKCAAASSSPSPSWLFTHPPPHTHTHTCPNLPNSPQLGIPTDFVKKSKLERELIQLDKDLTPRKEKLKEQAAEYESMAQKARYIVYVLLVVAFWRTPLLVMSPAATWPLSSFFAFPRLGPGAVGVSATIAMVKAVLRPFVPLLSSV